MWVVVYYSGSTQGTPILIFGPFTSEQAAQAFIAAQNFPGFYSVNQVWTAPNQSPPQPVQPQNVVAGNWIVCLLTSDAFGSQIIWLYGVFSNQNAAWAWISQQSFPAGMSTAQVQTPPS